MGCPGGYPVRTSGESIDLDLPRPLSRDEAIAWNARFEDANGLVVTEGRVRYTGVLRDLLREHAPSLAEGFALADLEEVYKAMSALRAHLQIRA